MYKRKVEDARRVRRIWWVEPSKRKFFEKNRKKCSCWMCGNPRKVGLDSPKGIKEQALLLHHRDEISEYLQETNEDTLYVEY